jgi:TP53 regulating kinase-like protein
MIQGAEAEITIQGEEVLKERPEKEYRHEKLDTRIREERTSEEVKNIEKARKHGVNIPETEKTGKTSMKQDRVGGDTLKKTLPSEPELMEEVGKNIGLLHGTGLVHGDLTTSNIMYDGKIWLIDLGLSETTERIEDQAVDIYLLKKTLETSHPEQSTELWEGFKQGYRDFEKSEEVLETMEEVQRRGRYK